MHTLIPVEPNAPVMVMAEVDIFNDQFEILISWQVCT